MVPLSFGCGSAVFAAIATLAPSAAARSAIASPMPRLPPDTNSGLPLRDVIGRTPAVQQAVSVPSPTRGEGTPFVRGDPSLNIRVQNSAARFRQRKGRKEDYPLSRERERRGGGGERCRGRGH